jgi:aspartyl-tRNA(Asn)/glutamyl-tRNA(Gln) amidotransferase subunit B
LQEERIQKYISQYALSEYDARVLTEEKAFADYFEQLLAQKTIKPKSAANWLSGPVKSWLNENNREIHDFPLPAAQMIRLIELVDAGKLSFSIASSRLFSILLQHPEKDPEQIAAEQNLIQQSDSSQLEPVIDEVLEKHAAKVAEYKKGKKGLLSLFVGEVMKQSKGQADPKITNEILLKKLNT